MDQIVHEKFTIKRIKGNFLSIEIHEGQTIDAEEIHLIYKGYHDLVGNNEYVVAVYANHFSSISPEAREISAKEYADPKRKKVAMITDNMAHVLMLRFFIAWNKPKTTIKIFRSEENAFEWLESR